MRDIELYTKVLGIAAPWKIVDAKLNVAAQSAEVVVVHDGAANCSVCGEPTSKYDTRPRRWRHLDFCQYELFVVADVPRVDCEKHGVKQSPCRGQRSVAGLRHSSNSASSPGCESCPLRPSCVGCASLGTRLMAS